MFCSPTLLANFLQNCVKHFADFLILGNNDLQEENESPTIHGSKDNRELVDNNTSQSLTGEDIDEMRRLELFNCLCNCSSFNEILSLDFKTNRKLP